MPLVHQAVASLVPCDAVSQAALRLHRLSHELRVAGGTGGFEPGKVLAEGIHKDYAGVAVRYDRLAEGDRRDVIVYHLSTDSPIAEWLKSRPERVVVYYHNLTPSFFLAPYDPLAARRLEAARAQMHALAARVEAAAAPSSFSIAELEEAGYATVLKVPYPLAPIAWDRPPRRIPDGAGKPARPLRLLFVGRITPNKALEQLLRLTALLRKLGVSCETDMVGGVHLPLYRKYLEDLAESLGLGSAPFVGQVSGKELESHYRRADFFVSFSRHEGFFVPAAEAMARGLPVIALARGAVPETVGWGGVVVPEDDTAVFAAVILELLEAPRLYEALSVAGPERSKELCDPGRLREAYVKFISAG